MTESTEQAPFQYPEVFTSEYGKEVPLLRPTAKVSKRVYKEVGVVAQKIPFLRSVFNQMAPQLSAGIPATGDVDTDAVMDSMVSALTEVPDSLSNIASYLSGWTVEEIEEDLTYADMIHMFALFFALKADRFKGVSVRLSENFQNVKLSELSEQASDEATS